MDRAKVCFVLGQSIQIKWFDSYVQVLKYQKLEERRKDLTAAWVCFMEREGELDPFWCIEEFHMLLAYFENLGLPSHGSMTAGCEESALGIYV